MPELPEVETVKNTLKKRLINKKIVGSYIYWDNIIAYPGSDLFVKRIKNQAINDIKRRGKFILFILDDYILLSHLRMEGKYFFKEKNFEKNKHDHVILRLDDGINLVYNDTRKFGKMYLIEKDKINEIGPIKDLGYEPFDDNLNIHYLKCKYKNKKLPIKTVLLDQSIITGIGNIYADEVLFLSKINPLTKCCDLKDEDLKNIIDNTKIVLNKAIKLGGTTIHSYTSVDGVSGKFQNELLVHNHEKDSCQVCNSEIIKIRVGGRGTYYCPLCQK